MKILTLAVLALIIAGCTGMPQSNAYEEAPSEEEAIADVSIEDETPEPKPDSNAPVLCDFCWDHYVGEDLRADRDTSPMNIRDDWEFEMVDILPNSFDEFLTQFGTVHEFTYQQWETEFYSTFVIWPDETLYDFSFVSLELGGDDYREIFFVRETLLTIDELLPNHAVILNVAFVHYLIPRGGIMFTDTEGIRHRMFITDGSPRGGCWPHFSLFAHTEDHWAGWVD